MLASQFSLEILTSQPASKAYVYMYIILCACASSFTSYLNSIDFSHLISISRNHLEENVGDSDTNSALKNLRL